MRDELRRMVSSNEQILYEGKPNKLCFIFESVFNPMLPFAIIWAIVDFGILGSSLMASSGEMLNFIIPFMLIHLMPVWIYLFGIIMVARRYKNTSYIVSDQAIYVSGGSFNKTFNVKPFAELSHVNLHRGIFDQIFKVGDIIITSSQFNGTNNSASISINSIDNYLEVYDIIKKLQKDIYSDIMYPNDKRPPENHGYNTVYKG